MKVAVVGLGGMGHGIASRVLAAGHTLAVYNRTRSRADDLAKGGARVASSPADAARGAELVLTMVADDAALAAVVSGHDGVLSGLEPAAVHAALSTVSPAFAEKLAGDHAAAGRRYVAAPVFGRPEAAAAGKLWVVAGGAAADVERARPVFEAFSRGLTHVGERPAAANTVKLAGNFMIASVLESLGEAFALVRKSGIAPDVLATVVGAVLSNSPIVGNYAATIAQERYGTVGFALPLGLKDLKLVLAAAEAAQAPMPVASLVHDQLLSALAQGHGDKDWSVIAQLAAERAGL
jgi:3-hydroxyisobutyrate dehydrogenase-like beta-hydroxyacid dehydrogenase